MCIKGSLIKERGAWKGKKSPGYGWYKDDADYKKSVGQS